jgi:microcin C transport system substrate-binding protein
MYQWMVYEYLLDLHPTTLEYIPALATHWHISDDNMEFRFRLNPNARFSDGEPITAEDVVASWRFQMDPGLQAPSNPLVYGKLEVPVAASPDIVRVRAKDLNWRNFLDFSASMPVLPAHVLEENIDRGNSIMITRRNEYWGEGLRHNVGLFNFDEVQMVVVRDENLTFEMFKRGDIDFYSVSRAQRWVEEMDFDAVQRGLVQKRKIYNQSPWGYGGFAMNMRNAPFDDIRVREAMNLLFNRAEIIDKLMYNEYEPQNSYYGDTPYENPDNPAHTYDTSRAVRLLAEAGWSQRDANGILTRNGQPFQIELLYYSPASEPYITVYQEDLRRVGINMNLRLVTPETQFQLINERRFQIANLGWGGLLFPNPETSAHSSLADVDNTNNIVGVKNERIDDLLVDYDRSFDQEERIGIIQEIDGILADTRGYVLSWNGPFYRIAYWNKFGMPESGWARSADMLGTGNGPGLVHMWWIDPEKERDLAAARADGSATMEVGETEVRYWLEYDEARGTANLIRP